MSSEPRDGKWRGLRPALAERPLSLRLFSSAMFFSFMVVAVVPIAMAFGASWDLDAYRNLLSSARQWGLLRTSLGISLGTAALATALGAPAGFALQRGRPACRRLLGAAMTVPFLIPPYVFAVAWIDLVGNSGVLAELSKNLLYAGTPLPELYTIPGTIFVLALCYYPVVVFATVTGLRRMDVRLEEAALLVSGRLLRMRAILIPGIGPPVLAGCLFVFLLALVNFSVPSLLQINVYPVEIYSSFSAFYDVPGAVAQSVPILVCGIAAWAAYGACIRPRRLWAYGRAPQVGSVPLPRAARGFSTFYCWGLVMVSCGFPMAVLIHRALPLTSLGEAWLTAREEMGTSLIVASISATALTAMAYATAYLRRRGGMWRCVHGLGAVAFLASGPVLGIGLITLLNRPVWLFEVVYDGLAVMVMACMARYLFFAQQGAATMMAAVNPRLDEAAAVCGVPWWRQAVGVLLPILRPGLICIWGFAFLLSLREIDATVLVCPPGASTVAVRLYTLMHYGPSCLVASLCLWIVGLTLCGGGVAWWGYRSMERILNAGD